MKKEVEEALSKKVEAKSGYSCSWCFRNSGEDHADGCSVLLQREVKVLREELKWTKGALDIMKQNDGRNK